MFDIVVTEIDKLVPFIPQIIGFVVMFDMIRLLITGKGGN